MAARQRGVVLTYVDKLETLEDCIRIGEYDTVKVVTGWGLASGWNPEARKRVLNMVPNVIVRTVSGDPSYARPFDPLSGKPRPGAKGPNAQYWDYDFPKPDLCEREIQEWYSIRPDIMVEIGNEPNVFNQDDEFIWAWAYWLEQSIKHCKKVFPQATFISPGFMMDKSGNMRRFYEIANQQIRLFDMIGVHFYEYYAFAPDGAPATKGELRDAIELHKQFFPEKPWYITEYGINDTKQVPKHEKGIRYAKLVHGGEGWPPLPDNVVGAVYYHLAMKGDLHPEYHIYPEGDKSYREACAAAEGALAQIEIFGASPDAAPPVPAGPLGDIPARLALLIADLAEHEGKLVDRRASAFAEFSDDDAKLLRRIQKMRSALERALGLGRDAS
nr:hypothetical protein [Oscillochloris trichoides]